MTTGADSDRPKKRPPHLTYSAFCLAARDRTTGFLKWISAAKSAHYLCPVKQKRALLESTPPRDSWTERRRNKTVSTFGEVKTSPEAIPETFISEPEHAFQNSSNTVSKSSNSFRNGHWQTKTLEKNHLSSYPFFRSKPTKDANWVYEHLYRPYVSPSVALALFSLVPIALLLLAFQKTRGLGGASLYLLSLLFGFALWFYSLMVAGSHGPGWVIGGLLMMGLGVIVTAIFSSAVWGQWGVAGILVLSATLIFGARMLGWAMAESQIEKHDVQKGSEEP